MDDACLKKHRQIPYLWTWEGSYSTKDARHGGGHTMLFWFFTTTRNAYVLSSAYVQNKRQQSTFHFVTTDGLGKPSTSNLFVPLDHLFSHINSTKHIQYAFEIEFKQRKLATLRHRETNPGKMRINQTMKSQGKLAGLWRASSSFASCKSDSPCKCHERIGMTAGASRSFLVTASNFSKQAALINLELRQSGTDQRELFSQSRELLCLMPEMGWNNQGPHACDALPPT